MSSVIVAGSINMDLVAIAERHPLPGETVAAKSLQFFPGGKGANQAIAAARLGAETIMIGKLGNDAFADELHSFLHSQCIDISHVTRTSEGPSGTALIVVAGSENTIVVNAGTNDLLGKEDIEPVALRGGDIILSQFETPLEATKHFFIKGKATGALSILNASPAKAGAEDLLVLADILVVNETELAFFVGEHRITPDSILTAAGTLRAKPEQIVIVTLGASGVYVLAGGTELHISGRKTKSIDPTGAGDCFVGALAARLADKDDLEACVTYANVAASICVQRLGAGTSMPTANEVNRILKES